jgi:hypothetical protein
MVAAAYKISHNCSDQLKSHVLVAGFTGQLKGWWDNHLSEENKQKIFHAVRVDPSGEPIHRDGHTILDSANALVDTIIKSFIDSAGTFREMFLKYLTILGVKPYLILSGIRIPFSPESMKDQMETSHIIKKNSLMHCLIPL